MQIAQVNVPAHRVDLGVGQPDFSLLPTPLMAQAAEHCLAQGNPAVLQYGAVRGSLPFREALAALLTREYGAAVSADNLLVTGGASQGLDLICSRLTRPGDTVVVEDPTYFLASGVLRDHGLQMVGVPVDDEGMCVDALQGILAQHAAAFVYTIPAFHNPCSVTLSAKRRQQLLQVTAAHGVPLVADEVYQMLHFGEAPPLSLACHPGADHVLSLGSFSKILAPGLRLGWIQGPKERLRMLSRAGYLVSGGGVSPFTAALTHSAIELGLQDRHLQDVRQAYATRCEALCTALRQHLGDRVRFLEPKGGFFVWVQLEDHVDAGALAESAKKHDVTFRAGADCSCTQSMGNFGRLSFAYYSAERLRVGAERLAKALADLPTRCGSKYSQGSGPGEP